MTNLGAMLNRWRINEGLTLRDAARRAPDAGEDWQDEEHWWHERND